MIQPSCPAYVIHNDDDFRNRLIKALDQSHFSVTFAHDGEDAVRTMQDRTFNVILLGLNLKTGDGMKAVEYLRGNREHVRCGVIIVGDAAPELRTFAPWADETLLKPVDPSYVAKRARSYCGC
jgi:DNA-binding response OmpR family regulator